MAEFRPRALPLDFGAEDDDGALAYLRSVMAEVLPSSYCEICINILMDCGVGPSIAVQWRRKGSQICLAL